MRNKFAVALTVLLAANLAVTLTLCVRVFGIDQAGISGTAFERAEKYTLYVGTNDPDTYAPVMPLADAKAKLNALCLNHVDGFTVMETQGGWLDEKGQPTREETLVYSFVGATESQIAPLLDEMLAALNQRSILVERGETLRAFHTAEP